MKMKQPDSPADGATVPTTVERYTLAIDVGGSHITVALVSDEGVVEQSSFPVDASRGLRSYLDPASRAVGELLGKVSDAASHCTGVAMAVPLLVDSFEGRVVSAPRDKFGDATGIDFHCWASESFGLPIRLEVDAHAGCLGEWIYGAGRGCEDLVYVTLGTGYGTSVILRGKALRGRTSQAGILGGHLSVNAGGHQCVCPGRGCVEAETGTWALDGIIREHPDYPASSLARYETIDYRILIEDADAGDSLAQAMFERSLNYWAASLVNLTHAYNPARIVMAGSIMNAAERIIPHMNKFLRRQVWTASDYPEVVVASHRETSALLGCRALFTHPIEYI